MKKIILINSSRTPQPLLLRAFGILQSRGFIFVRSWFSRGAIMVLGHWPEKIFMTPLARLFGKRVMWLDMPGVQAVPSQPLLSWLYQRAQRQAEVIVFGHRVLQAAAVHTILPAAMPEPEVYQHDLFSALADRQRRRFVIASIIPNLDKRLVERLLSALAVTLTICPSMELLIIGEGEGRKRLQWLIRRMDLQNKVWLVGESATPSRWFEDVNVYIVAEERPGLDSIAGGVAALRCGVPVLTHTSSGLEDIVTAKTGALIDLSDTETLARQLLRLEQDEELRKNIGAEAKRSAEHLTFERFTTDLATIFST